MEPPQISGYSWCTNPPAEPYKGQTKSGYLLQTEEVVDKSTTSKLLEVPSGVLPSPTRIFVKPKMKNSKIGFFLGASRPKPVDAFA